jgi:putative ABC transport system permease protein
MGFLLTLRIAFRALAKNKLRAGLTVLGIVIGVAAVVLMVAIGEGARTMVQKQFESLGTNVIVVVPGSMQGGGVHRGSGSITSLTADDAHALPVDCPAVLASTPLVGARTQIVYGNVNWVPNEILGADIQYPIVRNWAIERGGFFTERDVHAANKVCVIGRTIAQRLFQTADPIGKTIRIKNIPFAVIGVLEPKGANLVGQDQDNVVVAPWTTVKKRVASSAFNNVDMVLASARSVERMSEAENEVRLLLRERHHIRPGAEDDFTVRNTSEVAEVLSIITGVMTALLASIASVSLVVGGVGIMNIMLVSVTERTREIGIRLAVGARSRDILNQFLVEAILLSSLGGVLGALLGVGTGLLAARIINWFLASDRWPAIIPLEAVALAVVFAGCVGMFFGFYPARKASLLDPIECLRYE